MPRETSAKKLHLATVYNEKVLTSSFPSEVCREIGQYLTFSDLMSLFSTCTYFRNGNVLTTCFEDYFPNPPRMSKQKDTNLSGFSFLQQRINMLVSLGDDYCDRDIIKKWLLMSKEMFDKNSELFCIKIVDVEGPFNKQMEMMAYHFFSYIGAFRHFVMLINCIKNWKREKVLMISGGGLAFRLAATYGHWDILRVLINRGDYNVAEVIFSPASFLAMPSSVFHSVLRYNNLEMLSLTLKFLHNCNSLKGYLLHDMCSELPIVINSILSKGNPHVETVELLLNFFGNNEHVKRKLFKINENTSTMSIFDAAANNGRIDLLKLLWNFVANDMEVKKYLLTSRDCFAFRKAHKNSYFDVIDLLWNFASEDENLLEHVRNGNGIEKIVESKKRKITRDPEITKASKFSRQTFFNSKKEVKTKAPSSTPTRRSSRLANKRANIR